MAESAIHNGADAIYVGFPGFNARGRSYDFELNELEHIIQLCHLYGVKVNLAFNILIFENELPLVVEALKKVLLLKPDALIVQDLGLVRLIKEMSPEQVVHASTQMTITNDLAIELLQDLDIRRFVLGRENSLSEIELIQKRTEKELEVFVHGALCVSYSGQCLTSETLGGRSANRGQCAQSCRFSYDLIVDGEKKNLVDRNYLVSPQDLCGLNEVPRLMEIGVKSFKVEGRLKSPDYVAQVARSYRSIIDQTLSQKTVSLEDLQIEKNKMAVEYSRGFFPGWLHGVNHQELVQGTFSAHRGLEFGRITSTLGSKITVQLSPSANGASAPKLEAGDGVSWFENGEKKGAPLFFSRQDQDQLTLEFPRSVFVSAHAVGSLIYFNHDKSQKKDLERSRHDRSALKKIPVQVKLRLQENDPLLVEVTDGRFEVKLQSDGILVRAEKKPLSFDFLLAEFSSLGGTCFELSPTNFQVESLEQASLFLNHKEIKQVRQKAFEILADLRKSHHVDQVRSVTVHVPSEFQAGHQQQAAKPTRQGSLQSSRTRFHVLLRNRFQVEDLEQAIQQGDLRSEDLDAVTLDFEFGRDYASSLEKLRIMQLKAGLATTRILKPQEYMNLKVIHGLNPDFILVRNLGALHYLTQVHPTAAELKGDFSLNVTNHLSFEYLISKGLSSICLSYDLNSDQTFDLLHHIDASKAEITLHQFMPSFHMEHCVFAAFLSKGKSYRDCGKPCEKHQVQLRDQFGHHHWIKPDQECRNTMFNASAQTALPYWESWKLRGLGEVRYEALHERKAELITKVKTYTQVLRGEISTAHALHSLQTQEKYGLSSRQLAKSQEYQSRKKDHRFLGGPESSQTKPSSIS